MRYIIFLVSCTLLFTQCRTDVDVQPTGTYDTLGIRWMTIERKNIVYHFQGSGVKAASIFTDMHEEAYEELAPVFNPVLPQKLRFFVWTDWEEAERLLGLQLGFTTPYYCECNVTATQTLGHEMTHALSFWINGELPVREEKFIAEGVAVAFDLRGDDKMETARDAIAGKNIQSVTEVWSGSIYQDDDEVLYPLGGAFMDYMYKQSTREQFFAFLKNQSIEDAEDIYGKEKLNELIRDFNSRLGL